MTNIQYNNTEWVPDAPSWKLTNKYDLSFNAEITIKMSVQQTISMLIWDELQIFSYDDDVTIYCCLTPPLAFLPYIFEISK